MKGRFVYTCGVLVRRSWYSSSYGLHRVGAVGRTLSPVTAQLVCFVVSSAQAQRHVMRSLRVDLPLEYASLWILPHARPMTTLSIAFV